MKPLIKTGTLLAVMAVLSLQATPSPAASDDDRDQVRENFREADADGDGKLTEREFTTLIDLNARHGIGRAKLIASLGRYDMAFSRVDADANGIVTPEELSALAAAR